MKQLGLLWMLALMMALPAHGQSLVDLFRSARVKAQAEDVRQRFGDRVPAQPPIWVASPADTIYAHLAGRAPSLTPPAPPAPPPLPAFVVDSVRVVRKLERNIFRQQFQETLWSFLGSNTITPLDTMYTWDLRARLEARFGPPTQTLAELENHNTLPREAFVQFEYWFVLNDSIPLMVMDVNGPFERGLVVAGDHRYRDALFDIRWAFLEQLLIGQVRSPYVDYYFNYDERAWYLSGFDGASFFLRRIQRPALYRGRPFLNQRNE